MAMQDIELDVGGVKFKGVYIAILFSFASTIGGGIWAASEFFSRLEAQEEATAASVAQSEMISQRFEDLKESQTTKIAQFDNIIATVKQQLADNDIGSLQGKLAQLATNLDNIMTAQEKLLELRERVSENDKKMKDMEITVQKAESISRETGQLKEKIEKVEKEVEDLWSGMDYLANPLG
jgi:chromosome segregation ATPase